MKKCGDQSSFRSKISLHTKNQVSSSKTGNFGFLELCGKKISFWHKMQKVTLQGGHDFRFYACMQKIRLTASKLRNLLNEALKWDM